MAHSGPQPGNSGLDARVLVLAMLEGDRVAVCRVLSGAGFETILCGDIQDLCGKMAEGAGTAILTTAALAGEAIHHLYTALVRQPRWSDFPIIILTAEGEEESAGWRMLRELKESGYVLLIERPVHSAALITAVRTTLQSRRRQYEVRNLLEERQRLIDMVPVLLGYVDRRLRYRFVNRGYEEMFGMPCEEIVGLSVKQVIGAEAYRRTRPNLRRALQGEVVEYEDLIQARDGSFRTILLRTSPDRDGSGFYISAIDITESRQAATARVLSAGLIQGQEEERRRIARELHDDFVQRTAYLAIELDSIAMRSEELDKALRPAREQLILLSDEMRRLSHQLHPSILDDLGLEIAIRHECENAGNQKGLAVDFRISAKTEGLSKDVQLCLYRIVQEALRNVCKHARASRASVLLETDADQIGLWIEDDGVGFDPASCSERRGIGLSTMRERVRPFRGRLNLKAEPGSGTKIEVLIPTARADTTEAVGVEYR